MADLIPGASVVDQFRRRDFDAETAETDIGELSRCQQLDRGDAQILENLGAEPDLAPLPRARNLGTGRARLRNGMGGHSGRTISKEHDDASAFLLEPLQGGVHWIGAAKDIADDIGAMQTRQHVPAVADAAVDEGHMLDGVERRHIGVARKRTDLALYREFADALDEFVARLPVRDDISDRN